MLNAFLLYCFVWIFHAMRFPFQRGCLLWISLCLVVFVQVFVTNGCVVLWPVVMRTVEKGLCITNTYWLAIVANESAVERPGDVSNGFEQWFEVLQRSKKPRNEGGIDRSGWKPARLIHSEFFGNLYLHAWRIVGFCVTIEHCKVKLMAQRWFNVQ